jgi:hypothetical protein
MSKPRYWACTCCPENCLVVTPGEPPAACILDPDDTDEVPWREITRDEFQRRDDLVNDPSYIAQTMGDVPSKEIREDVEESIKARLTREYEAFKVNSLDWLLEWAHPTVPLDEDPND